MSRESLQCDWLVQPSSIRRLAHFLEGVFSHEKGKLRITTRALPRFGAVNFPLSILQLSLTEIVYGSRKSRAGSIERARRAGTHVAMMPRIEGLPVDIQLELGAKYLLRTNRGANGREQI